MRGWARKAEKWQGLTHNVNEINEILGYKVIFALWQSDICSVNKLKRGWTVKNELKVKFLIIEK